MKDIKLKNRKLDGWLSSMWPDVLLTLVVLIIALTCLLLHWWLAGASFGFIFVWFALELRESYNRYENPESK